MIVEGVKTPKTHLDSSHYHHHHHHHITTIITITIITCMKEKDIDHSPIV